jgi:hypothetical protein
MRQSRSLFTELALVAIAIEAIAISKDNFGIAKAKLAYAVRARSIIHSRELTPRTRSILSKRHTSAVSFSDAVPSDLRLHFWIERPVDFVGSHIFPAIVASFEIFATTEKGRRNKVIKSK